MGQQRQQGSGDCPFGRSVIRHSLHFYKELASEAFECTRHRMDTGVVRTVRAAAGRFNPEEQRPRFRSEGCARTHVTRWAFDARDTAPPLADASRLGGSGGGAGWDGRRPLAYGPTAGSGRVSLGADTPALLHPRNSHHRAGSRVSGSPRASARATQRLGGAARGADVACRAQTAEKRGRAAWAGATPTSRARHGLLEWSPAIRPPASARLASGRGPQALDTEFDGTKEVGRACALSGSNLPLSAHCRFDVMHQARTVLPLLLQCPHPHRHKNLHVLLQGRDSARSDAKRRRILCSKRLTSYSRLLDPP